VAEPSSLGVLGSSVGGVPVESLGSVGSVVGVEPCGSDVDPPVVWLGCPCCVAPLGLLLEPPSDVVGSATVGATGSLWSELLESLPTS
jgi:hypothetical protein